MGTSGLVGPLMTYQDMAGTEEPLILIIKIITIQFLLPALIVWYTTVWLRKKNLIKNGDMKLETK